MRPTDMEALCSWINLYSDRECPFDEAGHDIDEEKIANACRLEISSPRKETRLVSRPRRALRFQVLVLESRLGTL